MLKIQENSRRLRDELFPQIEESFLKYREAVRKISQQQEEAMEQHLQELQHRQSQLSAQKQLEESALGALQEENHQLEALIEVDKRFLDSQSSSRSSRAKPDSFKREKTSEELKTQELLSRDLRRTVQSYERFLGIAMRRQADQGLKVTFSYVCRGREDLEHSCVVYVRGDMYEVEQCTPKLDGLQELVAQVNATNNFSGFVKQLRRQFCRLYV